MPPTIFPKGVTIYKPEKAYNCFVLFDGRDAKSYLIDMNGNNVKVWNYLGFPVEMIDPILANGERGHVIVQKEPDMFANETLLELDWNGHVVWEWGKKAPGGKAWQNHDLARLPNGNTLIISWLVHVVPGLSKKPISDQPMYEIAPNGDIVWKWIPSEHMDEFGFSTAEARELLVSNRIRPTRTHYLGFNNMAPLGPNKWYKAGDQRFRPENIMTDSAEGNFIIIIEKKTGKIVWRLGPDYPAAYDDSKKSFRGKFPRPVDLISGQQDAHLIPEGLPGAGNILVFDNQRVSGFPPFYLEHFPGSRVLEIDPISKEIVWQYDAKGSNMSVWAFFSCFASNARRLPNGNTLINETMHGRLFQVTPEGEIVWEYVNPHFSRWTSEHATLGVEPVNWIYRAQPIPYDWVPEGTPHSENPVTPPNLRHLRMK